MVVKSAVAAVARLTTVGGIAVVLVSAGLVEVLPEAERETVLAHPANGDGWVMGTAPGPVSAAALERPIEARERPEADLRERSAAVIDVLQPQSRASRPVRVAPITDRRPRRMFQLVD